MNLSRGIKVHPSRGKGRSILDNFKYVQGGKLFWKRKILKILLKLDISKAFDTVAWPFLLELLQS